MKTRPLSGFMGGTGFLAIPTVDLSSLAMAWQVLFFSLNVKASAAFITAPRFTPCLHSWCVLTTLVHRKGPLDSHKVKTKNRRDFFAG